MSIINLVMVSTLFLLIIVPSTNLALTERDFSSQDYALTRFLIESIERYSYVSRKDLPRSDDVAQAFINEFSGTGVSISWWRDYLAWQEDWWTDEAGGDNFILNYHLVIFIGHEHYGGNIYFGRFADRPGRPHTDYVDFTGWVNAANAPEVHPYCRIKWIILASCETLKDDNAWTSGSPVYQIASRTFNGREDNIWNWNDMYLHVMVGMYTNFLQEDGLGIDYASPTLQSFAVNLKNGYTVKNAWFNAVEDHQRVCYGPFCTWVGKAAAMSPFIKVYNQNGELVASYYYSDETLYSIYQRPIDLVNYYLQQGYNVVLGWVYYHQ